MLWIAIALLICVVCVWTHGRRTRSCGPFQIGSNASCDKEGRTLTLTASKCRAVLDHPSVRSTPWGDRARTRWDGTFHQLLDGGDAPAVTTHKRDIRVCLDHATSDDAVFFVCLHELSHIACDSFGHTDEFWSCFDHFLRAAEDLGLYTHHPGHSVCGAPLGPAPRRGKI